MQRAAAVVLLLVACSKKPSDGGLVVRVVVSPSVKADCVAVVAWSTGGKEHSTEIVPRKGEHAFGVVEGDDLHGEAHLVARGYLGACSAPTLNAQSAERVETFKAGEVGEVTLELEGALDDKDHDGFRARDAGGTDCDDTSVEIAPGLDERCADRLDNDCDGLIDCADSPRCDEASCDDGLGCTAFDICTAGACHGTESCPAATACARPLGCGADGGCQVAVDAGSDCDGGRCRESGECIPLGQEFSCVDGVDNDADQQIDCDDVDCQGVACDDGRACTHGDVCQPDVGCTGVITCSTPPTGACWASMGACSGDGGCEYFIAAGAACDDGQLCTAPDLCRDDGGCMGTSYSCGGAGSCFSGGSCQGDGGCNSTALSGVACDDSNLCTAADSCDAGACVGAPFTCTDTECTTGFCRADGGCGATPLSSGVVCTGGQCDGQGVCVLSLWPFVPSNFLPAQIPDAGYGAAVVLAAGCDAVFDSSDGGFAGWCGQPQPTPIVVTQIAGGPLVLLPLQGLTIAAGASLRLIGTRPVAIAVAGDATIEGALLASSEDLTAAAGANPPACGAAAGENGGVSMPSQRGGGGGGGSFASGGSDGAGVTAGTFGRAGTVMPMATPLRPLRGGCRGGNGGASNAANAGRGGNGGGALQLSVTGQLLVSGIVSASGAGGRGGVAASAGAGGGGSGGGILLEGAVVELTATAAITCNGGGGGEGSGTTFTGDAGMNGAPDSGVFAVGGTGNTTGGGDGANGASRAVDAGAVTAAACVPAGNGGEGCGAGGGGLGRVRIEGYKNCVMGPPTISALSTINCP